MTEGKRRLPLLHRREEEPSEEEQLREGLDRTQVLIAQAYSGFNSTGDPDLIEAYVFEIRSLHARYAYLLRRVKELERIGEG